jgi:hypothetical protein
MQELKESAENLGDTLMEKQFGSYRYLGQPSLSVSLSVSHSLSLSPDEWEGIEVFKRSKKLRQNAPNTPSGPNPTSALSPHHVPFQSPSRNRAASLNLDRGAGGGGRRGSNDGGSGRDEGDSRHTLL